MAFESKYKHSTAHYSRFRLRHAIYVLLVVAIYLVSYYTSQILRSVVDIKARDAALQGSIDTLTDSFESLPGKQSTQDILQYVTSTERLPDEAPRRDGLSTGIGKVTMSYGSLPEVYQRALDRQLLHSSMHGYADFVLRSKIMPRLWSKPAYILSILLQELEKPKDERLQWLFWYDLDMVVMNPNIPLETFLPPDNGFNDVQLIVSEDLHGLNIGSFFVRVSDWAAFLFVDTLGMPGHRPEVKLKYNDQSAMEYLLKEERYHHNVTYVPQRWTNAFLGSRDANGKLSYKANLQPGPEAAREGDLLIHFAGKETTKAKMSFYLDIAESRDPDWEVPVAKTGLEREVSGFWEAEAIEKGSAQVTIEIEGRGKS